MCKLRDVSLTGLARITDTKGRCRRVWYLCQEEYQTLDDRFLGHPVCY